MITRPQWSEEDFVFDPMSGEQIEKDRHGVGITEVGAGQFFTGHPGEDLKLFEGDDTGAGFADFVRQELLRLAAAQDLPFEYLTGDLSKINDRVLRAINIQFYRIIEQTQVINSLTRGSTSHSV